MIVRRKWPWLLLVLIILVSFIVLFTHREAPETFLYDMNEKREFDVGPIQVKKIEATAGGIYKVHVTFQLADGLSTNDIWDIKLVEPYSSDGLFKNYEGDLYLEKYGLQSWNVVQQ